VRLWEGEDEKFKGEIEERLREHLIGSSLIGIKGLIREPERDLLDAQRVAEVLWGLERFNKIPVASPKKNLGRSRVVRRGISCNLELSL
jgi:hypothetical protein